MREKISALDNNKHYVAFSLQTTSFYIMLCHLVKSTRTMALAHSSMYSICYDLSVKKKFVVKSKTNETSALP